MRALLALTAAVLLAIALLPAQAAGVPGMPTFHYPPLVWGWTDTKDYKGNDIIHAQDGSGGIVVLSTFKSSDALDGMATFLNNHRPMTRIGSVKMGQLTGYRYTGTVVSSRGTIMNIREVLVRTSPTAVATIMMITPLDLDKRVYDVESGIADSVWVTP